jgi:hypothetical protein
MVPLHFLKPRGWSVDEPAPFRAYSIA